MGKLAVVKLSKEANEAQEAAAKIRRGLAEALRACDHFLDSFQIATKNKDQSYHDNALRKLHRTLTDLDGPVKDYYRRFVLVGNDKPARGRWGRFVYTVKKIIRLGR